LAQPANAVSVGFLSHYPPFSFRDRDGTLKGFDLDVMRRLCAIMGLNLVQVPEGISTLSAKLRSGEIAWIGNQLLTTPENRREFDFVRPSYASIQLTSVQHEDDNRDFLSLDDLVGKKLGVLAQTGIENQARGALGKSVVAYQRIEDALKDLAVKRLDVVLEENLIAEYYIERDALPIKVTSPFASPIPVGLAVRKGQSDMQDKLANAVKVMLKDGSLKAISEKWFGYDVSRARVGHSMSS
jgi:cystine transport system substrate-binding protein